MIKMRHDKTISANNTEKLYYYLKYNVRCVESFEEMAKHSAKMEKIARKYKKLYELSKNHLESFEC
jgi:hypothetical protein